ncbi:hypothetical protein Metev_2350 (plasmid) [Methanohalobium evestigatum Z-7303]|uniref:Uncharacterized protein n=1 Tax=Methanohalobium evestigatum (strain ATCC BAA-1072 / DSM 3721 / NBRC 107634 / OCM 161 / Z-7303) TaxID=644295 RepID=D7EC39_METEZ|nr:hypothetical protein Metev_2350 [Methanohalobium evestigatum Z-7303]
MGSVEFRKNTTKIYLVKPDKGETLKICIKGEQNNTDGGILATDSFGNKLKVKPEGSNVISIYQITEIYMGMCWPIYRT